MAKLSKRVKAYREKVDQAKFYSIDDAVVLLNELSSVKFKESIDVSINLGVDPRKSDQVVRGATVLPNGTGKTVRVAVCPGRKGRRVDRSWRRYRWHG